MWSRLSSHPSSVTPHNPWVSHLVKAASLHGVAIGWEVLHFETVTTRAVVVNVDLVLLKWTPCELIHKRRSADLLSGDGDVRVKSGGDGEGSKRNQRHIALIKHQHLKSKLFLQYSLFQNLYLESDIWVGSRHILKLLQVELQLQSALLTFIRKSLSSFTWLCLNRNCGLGRRRFGRC